MSKVEEMFGGSKKSKKGYAQAPADPMRETQMSQVTKYTMQSVNLYGSDASKNKRFLRNRANVKMVNDGRQRKKKITDDIFE